MSEQIAFVFSGIGTQWMGMAESLLANDAVFRDAIIEIDALLSTQQRWSLLELLSGHDVGVSLDRPEIAHPAIFSVQVGLIRCLSERGLQAAAVIGHSAGEVAAAVCAGALRLSDAVRVVAAHSELIAAVHPGAMLHVPLDPQILSSRIAAADSGLELAAVNSEQACVIAGTPQAIAVFDAVLKAEGIDTRLLSIHVPFHTKAVEPHLDAFRTRIADIRPRKPAVPIYSSLRGGLAEDGDFSADYWVRHIRETVRFPSAARSLFEQGVDRCIEVSPHPALLQHLASIAGERSVAIAFDATLQRGVPEPAWPTVTGPVSSKPLDTAAVTQALRECASEVLGPALSLDDMPHSKWAEIGCTSLQITQLMAKLSARLGKPLSVTLPYRHPTPTALIEALAGTSTHHAAVRSPIRGEEAVAIVGMACRLPGGANSPDALWEMLASGVDPVTDIPSERWHADAFYDTDSNAKGRSVTRWGSFISGQDLREFDAKHFRMMPREASALDPQQRLLLEVTWEALENAGFSVAGLKGKQVGVYVGISTDDYKNANLYRDLDALDPYAGAGAMSCTAAGRLSYFFGWEGPNMAIDTACSSSLVALHLASQALQSGECDVAVVGGVNALLTPHLFVYFSKAGIMSPSGRCHVFDDAADGYVRAEGCGILVLQRESDAARDGRRLRARVLGSAVNQDGASTGFSTPNGAAQQKVLRQAWHNAGVTPAEIGYLEAHGTGTQIGDPIELEAMAESISPLRSPQDPMPVGSIKSNLGHLEAAAGVGAVIKTVLALEHGELPANLHFRKPNSHIDWSRLPLCVVDRHQPFPERNGRRIAGISSFGFSGTNAHVVLEQAVAQICAPARPIQVLALGAHDRDGLHHLARAYARRISIGKLDESGLADLASSTHLARPYFPKRVAVAGTLNEIPALLQRWVYDAADGEQVFSGEGEAGPLVFAFTGQGCQYPGMARALYESEPVFRAVLDRCEAALVRLVGMRGNRMLPLMLDLQADADRLASTDLAQPAIFAVQCGLVALLASWGIKPDRVVGHSVGEFAAAVAAGALELEDGLALVAQRGKLMADMPSGGAMAAVQVDAQTAHKAIAEFRDKLTLAAINGKRAVVLSGDATALDAVLARLGTPGLRAKCLVVSHAYHSPLMAPAAQAFARVAPPLFSRANISWISSADGRDLSETGVDMQYWSRQILSPVCFDAALDKLEADGCRIFVEIGPAAVLTQMGRARGGIERSIMNDSQNAQSLTCSAPPGLQARIVSQADGMPSETPATPPALSQRERVRTAEFAVANYGKINNACIWIPAQLRGRDGKLGIATALAALAARGAQVDWAVYDDPVGRRRVDLPPYPFQRRRHWRDPMLLNGWTNAAVKPATYSTDAGHTVFVTHVMKRDSEMAQNASVSSSDNTAFLPVGDAALAAIHDIVAELTGMSGNDIDPDAALIDLGLDSLMLVQMKTLLANKLGLDVDMADFYGDLDTVAKLAKVMPVAAPVQATISAPHITAPSPCKEEGWDGGSEAEFMSTIAQPHYPHPNPPPARVRECIGGLATLPAANTALHPDLARLMSQQIEAMSRMISEQNAMLAGAPAAVPPAPVAKAAALVAKAAALVAKAAAPAKSNIPNFRSLKLDPDKLTPEQKSFIDELARRYAARTPSSKALADRTRRTLADWKNTLSFRYTLKEMMYPIVAATSHGSHFTDLDGNDFLDVTMGCGIALLGYSPECVTKAVHAQVDASFAIGPQTPLASEVAERFSRLTGMERVTFCNTGAEAVMMAVRIARAVTGRSKLVIFNGAYHGTWDGVLGVAHEGQVHPIDAGIPQGMIDDLVILNYGTDEALAALSEQIDDIAAVLVEPVQSRRPGFHPAEFMKRLRVITEQSGAALIFDEMITGFRILPGGAQAYYGIKADLATYGKIAGGGLPLSVVAGSARFMDAVDGGSWCYGDDSRPQSEVIYFGGTYVKHPLALAAAKASLDYIEHIGTRGYEELNQRSKRMADTLNAWFAQESVPLNLVHFGSLFRIDGTGRYSSIMQPIELDLFFLLLNLRSIYVWERRICFLSFAHTDAEIDRLIECVKEAVLELRATGFEFLSGRASSSPLPQAGEGPGVRVFAKGGSLAHALTPTLSRQREREPDIGPAASAQRRMFALAEIEGPSVVYNVPLAIRLRGALDLPRLEQSLATLVARHSALRTRFAVLDDALIQKVDVAIPFVLDTIEGSESQITERLNAFIRPFDLKAGPLFRTGLMRIATDQHVLIMDAHHIVVDGLSLNILAQELMASYGSQPLPETGAGMIDYALAEAAYLNSEACRRDAAYWREQFRTVPEPLQLPLDHPRALRRRHQGADLLAKLDSVATARLKAAARAHKMPVFPLLLTLYTALLHRLTAQDDIVIGLPVGGRTDPRFRHTIGMLTATLPLRMAAAPGETLAACARACHKSFLASLGHQAYPLEALIASLDLPRDTSRNPLFDTMFIYEDGNDRVYRMAGLECEPAEVSRHAAMFDITMEVVEAEGELNLRCEYDVDLFSHATAQGVLDLYIRLLHLAPDMLEQPIGDLNLIDAQQCNTILSWGDGGPAAEHGTVLQAFDTQLARTPDAPALVCGNTLLSYRELDQRANRLAHALLADGPLPPDTPVALIARRDVGLLSGMLGILRAGAAYVPVDPDFPLERVRLMLDAGGCRHVLASAGLMDNLPAPVAARVLSLDTIDETLPDTAPHCAITPERLAWIIFTSGSSGTPKGAMLTHRNAASFFASLPQVFGFMPGERILGVTTVSFDIAGLELIGALCCGMTVVLASEEQAREPAMLLALIEREKVNVMQMTPTRLKMLLDAPLPSPASGRGAGGEGACKGAGLDIHPHPNPLPPAGEGAGQPSTIRTLLVGGEALPQTLADQLLAWTYTRVFNVYGPTETTIWSASWLLEKGPVCLGHALPGEQLLVLSSGRRLQPPGAIGEIAIAGAGVARGYLNDSARTAQRFITLPGIAGPIYLTGDLGRWTVNGRLEYIGRRDDQIKIRGMRIEIGEIEHHLRQLPGVRDAAAAVWNNAAGEPDLVAYLVGPETDIAPLRAMLAARLPSAMLPSRFVFLPALPQTPNGKTDRRALPNPEPHANEQASRAPANPLEETITGIFSNILGRTIGPDDDFFLCGGHSLKAIQAIGRLNRELETGYTLRNLYRAPSAAALSRIPVSRTTPITRMPDAADYPLSCAQQALWVLQQMQPDYAGYNVPGTYLLQGTVDVGALTRAWKALVARHESLRTVFRQVNGQPRQLVLDGMVFSIDCINPTTLVAPSPLQVESWDGGSEIIQKTTLNRGLTTPTLTLQGGGNPSATLEAAIKQLTCQPFDLANGPLFRIALLPLAAERHILLLVTHHIISDGWSDAIMVKDLAMAYSAALAGQDPQAALPHSSAVRYRDFSAWQQRYLASPLAQTHRDYWAERLRNLPELELLTDAPRRRTLSRCGARVEMRLDDTEAAAWLAAIPPGQRYATLAAATLALLHLESGQSDLVLGLPIANRDRMELQDQVGLHLNMLPLRRQLRSEASLEQLRGDCADSIVEAMAHADYPFARLVDELGVCAAPGRHPVFDAMLIYHQHEVPVPKLEGVDVEIHDPRSYTSRFDLDVEVWTTEKSVHGFIEYDTELFTAEHVESIASRWIALLVTYRDKPSTTLSELRQALAPMHGDAKNFLAASLALDEDFY